MTVAVNSDNAGTLIAVNTGRSPRLAIFDFKVLREINDIVARTSSSKGRQSRLKLRLGANADNQRSLRCAGIIRSRHVITGVEAVAFMADLRRVDGNAKAIDFQTLIIVAGLCFHVAGHGNLSDISVFLSRQLFAVNDNSSLVNAKIGK